MFDHIVVTIEESKYFPEMNHEESQASLEAHELRLKQRNTKKVCEQALHAKFFKKMKGISSKNSKVKGKWRKKLKDDVIFGKASRIQDETSKNNAIKNGKFKKKVIMKEVQCYFYQKFCHYDRDYYFNKDNGDEKVVVGLAHAGSNDVEEVILMDTPHLN